MNERRLKEGRGSLISRSRRSEIQESEPVVAYQTEPINFLLIVSVSLRLLCARTVSKCGIPHFGFRSFTITIHHSPHSSLLIC